MRTLDLQPLLARHRRDPTCLVQLPVDVQEEAGAISPQSITALAHGLGLPRARVEGVAGCCPFFANRPRGEYRVHFSDDVTDHPQGSVALRERLCAALGSSLGEVSPDGPAAVVGWRARRWSVS